MRRRTTDNVLVVTDAEVADLEKQLDEIDQLLAGVDADLSSGLSVHRQQWARVNDRLAMSVQCR